jgi:Flp pilus assembly protein TadG
MKPRVVAGRKPSDWRGQTAVEFALGASLLFMLMFGIIKFGLAVYSYNTVSHTTRECVRYAFVHGPGSQNPQTASAIQQHFEYAYMPGGAPLSVTVTFPQDSDFPSLQDAQCSISFTYNIQIPFLLSKNLTLTSTEHMILSQ